MLHVNVPQLSLEKCRETLGHSLAKGTICAGHLPGGKDSCQVHDVGGGCGRSRDYGGGSDQFCECHELQDQISLSFHQRENEAK